MKLAIFMLAVLLGVFSAYNAYAQPGGFDVAAVSAGPADLPKQGHPSYDGPIDMVLVKGGCFKMGDVFGDGNDDEKPVHEVCVDDYFIGKYEVTQGQWKSVMPANQSYFRDCGDDCPVEQVSFNDVIEFIGKLNEKNGKNYRLPTEAEWEYAARNGGKADKFPGTSNVDDILEYSWYDDNSDKRTHPVGKKKPNGLGLFDLGGNVWEWVQDVYTYRAYSNFGKNLPPSRSTGDKRVVRGGSWFDIPQYLRTTKRYWFAPNFRLFSGGFRLAASAK